MCRRYCPTTMTLGKSSPSSKTKTPDYSIKASSVQKEPQLKDPWQRRTTRNHIKIYQMVCQEFQEYIHMDFSFI